MRTFAQKQNQPQKPVSSGLARPNIATPGPDHREHPILHLQSAIGNQAVQRMLRTNAEELKAGLTGTALPCFAHDFSRIPIHPPAAGVIQTKLAINKLGDEYEQEADRISEQVMRMPEPQIQRACACGGGCPKCQTEQPGQEHEHLQTKRVQASDTGQIAAPPIVHEVLAAPGQVLDPAAHAFMEPRFGHDFSHVRVHTDAKAAESARAMNAVAYTVGQHVIFRGDAFAPGTTEGKRLLAHELAHVTQQDIPVSPPDRTQASHPVTTTTPPVIFSPSPSARATKPASRPSVAPHSVYETVSAPGRPLEPSLLREMSALFQFDFSTVRVHTDDRAAATAADIHALAYAAGPHIVFSQGAFQPSTRPGRQVLAHELAHVVQEHRITSGKLVLGDPETAEEVSAERAAASIADRSQKAAHAETYGPPVAMAPVGRPGLPTPSVGMVRRIFVPPKPGPKLSPAQSRGMERFNEIDGTMRRWRHTYTQQTREATNRLRDAMVTREVHVESLQLDPAAEKRIQSITDRFFDELKQELARKPQDDPNQEGNVLAIWRKWDAAFSNKLAIEQLRQGAIDTAVPEEPGDYPRPENPLDLPQDKGEVERIA